ncbi:MAG: hypothetical protein AB4368_03185, partial [Xenococcaceae cyanobacterium]
MLSHRSLKTNFIYPKFLKPLGANGISKINPISMFPDGIPGYIAPKSQNFADSRFFFDNRTPKIITPNVTLQTQPKHEIINLFPNPSVEDKTTLRQEERENITTNNQQITSERYNFDNLSIQTHQIQNDSQHSRINHKSNIQPNYLSHLSNVSFVEIDPNTPNSDKSDNVSLSDTEAITPLNSETITPKLDKSNDLSFDRSETLTPKFDRSETLTPKPDRNAPVSFSHTETTTPSIPPASINR